jgi:hypothetical protein
MQQLASVCVTTGRKKGFVSSKIFLRRLFSSSCATFFIEHLAPPLVLTYCQCEMVDSQCLAMSLACTSLLGCYRYFSMRNCSVSKKKYEELHHVCSWKVCVSRGGA